MLGVEVIDDEGEQQPLPGRPGRRYCSLWRQWADRLAEYVGDAYPLARRVGAAAGAAMNAAYSPTDAYEFGLDRVLAALADLRPAGANRSGPAGVGGPSGPGEEIG